MRTLNKLFVLLLLPALLAGCSSITNLTPTAMPRSANGFYRVEAMWRSNREVIRPDSFKPLVVVDMKTYPMQPVALVKDRWEAYIPVAPGENMCHFHYKFDFYDNTFGTPKPDSLMSGMCEFRIK